MAWSGFCAGKSGRWEQRWRSEADVGGDQVVGGWEKLCEVKSKLTHCSEAWSACCNGLLSRARLR